MQTVWIKTSQGKEADFSGRTETGTQLKGRGGTLYTSICWIESK